jgi:hypothetical protein
MEGMTIGLLLQPNVYLKSQESLVEIDYHTTTHQGTVVSKKHFGNESTYCWDSALLNVDC